MLPTWAAQTHLFPSLYLLFYFGFYFCFSPAVLPMSSALNVTAALGQPGLPPPCSLASQQSPLVTANQPSPFPSSSISSAPFEVPFPQPSSDTAVPLGAAPHTPTFLPHLIGPPISPAALALASPMIGAAQKGARSSSAPLSLVAVAPHSVQKTHPPASPSSISVASIASLEPKSSASQVPCQVFPNMKDAAPSPPGVVGIFPSSPETSLACVPPGLASCPQTLSITPTVTSPVKVIPISSALMPQNTLSPNLKRPDSSFLAQNTVAPNVLPVAPTSLCSHVPSSHRSSSDSPIQPLRQSGPGALSDPTVSDAISVDHSAVEASCPSERSVIPHLSSFQTGFLPSRHELVADSVAALSVGASASTPAPSVGKGTPALTSVLCSPPSSSAVATTLSPTASLIPKGSSNATHQPLVPPIPTSQKTDLKETPVSGVGAIQPAMDNPSTISVAPATCVSPSVSSGKDPATISLVAPAVYKQFPAPPVSPTLGLPATEGLKNLPTPVLVNVGAPVSPAQAGRPARRDPTLLPLSLTVQKEIPSPQSASPVEELAPIVKAAIASSSSPSTDASAAIVRADPVSLSPKHSVTAPTMAPGFLESCDPEELAPRAAKGTSPATSTTSPLVPLASEGCPMVPSMAFPLESVPFHAPPPAGISFSGAKKGDGVSSVASLPSSPEGHPEDLGASVSSKGTLAHPAGCPSLETGVSPQTKGPSPKKDSALPGVSPADLSLSTPEASFLPGASLSFQGPKDPLNLSPIPPSSRGASAAPTETSVSPQKTPATSFLKDAHTVPAEIPLSPQKTTDTIASKLDSVTQPHSVPPIVPDVTPLSPKKTPTTPVSKDTSAALWLESVPAVTSLPPQKVPTAPSLTGTPIVPTESSLSLKNAPATATLKETLAASPPKVATIPAVTSLSPEKTPKSISPKGAPDKPSKKAPVASRVSPPKFPTEAPCVPAVAPPSPPKPTATEAISEVLTGPYSPKGAPATLAEGPSSPKRASKTAAPKETPPEGVTAVPLEITPSPKKTSKTIAPNEHATSFSKKSPKNAAPKETPTPSDSVTTASLEIPPVPKKAPKTATPKETLATPSVGITAVPLEISPSPKKAASPNENSAPSPKKSPKITAPKETPTPPSKGVTTASLEIPPSPKKAPKTAAQKQVSVTPSPKGAPATSAESPASPKTAAPKEAPAAPSPEGSSAVPLQIAPSPKKAPKENSAKSSPKKTPKTADPKETPITSSEGVTTAPLEITPSPKKASKTAAPKKTPATPSPEGSPALPLEITPSPQKISKTAAPKETSAVLSPKKSPKTAAPKETPVTSSEEVTTAPQQISPSPPTAAPKQVPVTPSPKGAPATLAESPASPQQAPKTVAPKETLATPHPQRTSKTAAPKETPAILTPEGVTAVTLGTPPSPQKASKIASSKETSAMSSPQRSSKTASPSSKGVVVVPPEAALSPRKAPKMSGPKETPTVPSLEGVTAGPPEISSSPKKAPKMAGPKETLVTPSSKKLPQTVGPKEIPAKPPSPKKTSKTAAAAPKETSTPSSKGVTAVPLETDSFPQKATKTAGPKEAPAVSPEGVTTAQKNPPTPLKASATPASRAIPADTQGAAVSSSRKKAPVPVALTEAPAALSPSGVPAVIPPSPSKSPKTPSSKKAPRTSAPTEFPANPFLEVVTTSLPEMAPSLQKTPATAASKEDSVTPAAPIYTKKAPAPSCPERAPNAPVTVAPREASPVPSPKKAPVTETSKEISTSPSPKVTPTISSVAPISPKEAPAVSASQKAPAPKETSESSTSKGVLSPTVNSPSAPKKALSSSRASALPAVTLPSLKEAPILSPITPSPKDSPTSPVSATCSTGTVSPQVSEKLPAKKDPTTLKEVLATPTPESALAITAPIQKGLRAKNLTSPPKCSDPSAKKDTKGPLSAVALAPLTDPVEKDSSKTTKALPDSSTKGKDCLHSPKGPVSASPGSQVATPLAAVSSNKAHPEAGSASVLPRPTPPASLTLAPSPVPPLLPKQPFLQPSPGSVLESASKLPAPADEDELPPLIPPEAVSGGVPFQPVLINMSTPKPAGIPAPAPSAKQPVLKDNKGICLGLLCAWCVAHTPLGAAHQY
ncbi:nascent polypeptide-associated complex subunit alpha, muscle-specific form-like isoform X2 [Cricetulus griseus]|uniref:Nascent polypeptide-associated complex subunit alpha, muscle-specific form-like isoform X2 n=1 Tax=Cricetulus griseus TaxID=10029 RepID=A0A9J7KD44_CRIGR|nr:nascent polypeptide-associated complex subunit alpha, muscle-specific form-like isoform X2 [Cricetulus griseus]